MQNIDQLRSIYKDQKWFYDAGTDQYGRYIVYVKFMNHETINSIPTTFAGKQLLVHFANHLTANADKFKDCNGNLCSGSGINSSCFEPDIESLVSLKKELDRLAEKCGLSILNNIFYEIHDGINAITNIAKYYPEVQSVMKELYDQYGFDVIYDELCVEDN